MTNHTETHRPDGLTPEQAATERDRLLGVARRLVVDVEGFASAARALIDAVEAAPWAFDDRDEPTPAYAGVDTEPIWFAAAAMHELCAVVIDAGDSTAAVERWNAQWAAR